MKYRYYYRISNIEFQMQSLFIDKTSPYNIGLLEVVLGPEGMVLNKVQFGVVKKRVVKCFLNE